jgi:hypothetical protein
METTKNLLEGIKKSSQLIKDVIFMCETRAKSTHFTRSGKISFQSLILFMLNYTKKSLQIELDGFFKMINDQTITKQAFSKARQKILPIAFIKLADTITTWFYGDDDFKTYKGYRLMAVDGSILELNNSETLRQAFGYVENQKVKLARAKSSCLYDIENSMIVTSIIAHYKTSERDLALQHIQKLKLFGLKNDLILFDRGYPSTKLISNLENNGIKYLMRVSSQFLKVINQAKGEDQIVTVKNEGQLIKIRVLRFLLDSGEEETLITNLLEPSFTVKDFKELYFKRWGIETKYDELKNRLQIENFTGDTKIAVEQDFYASIYLSNMAALAKHEADEKITHKNAGKNLKYSYKVNMNILIGKLKDSMVLMLLEDSPRKRTKMFKAIMAEISRNIIPIRPGRSFIREKKNEANRYSFPRKRCL